MMLTALVLAATLPAAAPAGGGAYPRPGLLREPADLRKAVEAGAVVVLDARAKADFEKGRVPSARWVDAAAWTKEFGQGEDAKGWSRRIGDLGIGSAGQGVVIYDDASFKDAARIWWILRYWGARDVALLQGNWKGWKAAGLPVETTAPDAPKAAEFPARPLSKRLALKKAVLDAAGKGSVQIVDARSEAEHCGTEVGKNRRGGAVPGSVHLDWVDLVEKTPAAERIKPAGELKELFSAAGIDPLKPSITYCQSGGRASVMAFGLELMGGDEVRNYHASWAEWGNAGDTPVVPGKPKERKK